ncbi:hypothetical protein T492DRAFT_831895 [Pavlovales sp. CCMP2436]|nr:hypothetical protein T492DRAFT_831895 [Pavlovales sp. CCMP2436]
MRARPDGSETLSAPSFHALSATPALFAAGTAVVEETVTEVEGEPDAENDPVPDSDSGYVIRKRQLLRWKRRWLQLNSNSGQEGWSEGTRREAAVTNMTGRKEQAKVLSVTRNISEVPSWLLSKIQ